ncbi:hypothetical protein CP533_2383 [Ophiocordyceps camponoti-saundersi (nom. inval.)]|nr:hypothetical protein CP533_2383 [Ophiocordyceps camponoti-saundersi (nom. inval.)]
MPSVNEIAFRAGLAAVNKDSSIRVYTLDVDGGVREIQYEGKWTGGTSSNVLAKARIGSPVAATSIGLDYIRVYYISSDCKVQEKCWDGKGWYDGSLGEAGFKVAPFSGGLSAIYLGGRNDVIRVYGQVENGTIEEFTYDGGKGWQKGHSFGIALPGTAITATTWSSGSTHIRVYYQDGDLNIKEKAWDGHNWAEGGFRLPFQPPRSALSAVSWYRDDSLNIRVYYAAAACMMREMAWDGGWNDGSFGEESVAGSCVTAIVADTLRTYVQIGNMTSGITEFSWKDGWVTTQEALPPA